MIVVYEEVLPKISFITAYDVAGRGPLPGPETGLLSNTRKWIVWGVTCIDNARDFIGTGHPSRE